MKGLRILLALTALLTVNLHYAQDSGENELLSLDRGPIDSQFEFIFKKSGNFKGVNGARYEAVRKLQLDKLRSNVNDTLRASYKNAAELRATISEHETTITSLNKKLGETTNNLASVTGEKDSMSFLGMQVAKATYNTILWATIAALLGTLLFFIYRFKKSNSLTQEARTNLSELEVEYEDHRRRALEREQKINRQLQDELNRQKKPK